MPNHWRTIILAVFLGAAMIAVGLTLSRINGPVRVASRNTPEPLILEMHNYDAKQFPAEWGEIGSWMYWGADQLVDNFDAIDAYLAKVNAPVAISIMLIEGIGADSTPYAAWGIPEGGWVEGSYSYPRWNDWRWDAAYKALVQRLGAKYDKDARVYSVWICAGLYGEAIFEKGDWKAGQHNPGRFVTNAIDWYVQAFPTKPLFFIGSVTARSWADYAASKGVGVKLNALGGDLPTHNRPHDGSGSVNIMRAVKNTAPVAFEHAYPNTPAQAYYATLTGLSLGMTVLDLPELYLQTLADTYLINGESLMTFTRRYMQGGGVFWLARDTVYPCPTGAWDCGAPGPFALDMTATVVSGTLTIYAPNALPTDAPDWVKALLMGAARLDGKVRFATPYQADVVRIYAVGSGYLRLSYGKWPMQAQSAESDSATTGPQWIEIAPTAYEEGFFMLEGNGWVHLAGMERVAMSETPVPYVTQTPTPFETPHVTSTWTREWTIAPPPPTRVLTETSTPTITPTPDYEARIADLEAAIDSITEDMDALRQENAQLRTWYQAARADLDRVLKLLDSWQGD